jgi:hypothetical protein
VIFIRFPFIVGLSNNTILFLEHQAIPVLYGVSVDRNRGIRTEISSDRHVLREPLSPVLLIGFEVERGC